MTAALKAHNQRAEFAERVRAANYMEYWEADYRTDKPHTGVVPVVWSWKTMKELMLESAQVIGINEAERRGLILINPGLGGKPFLTNTMFADVQILSPGEAAPAHRHTTSASRFFLEGEGGYTTVEGELCTMGPGDLVINPSWAWHDHGNNGKEEITYLNILDVPLVAGLGCTFYDHDYYKENDTSKTIQSIRKPRDRSQNLYGNGGIMPKTVPHTGKPYSPQLVYKYQVVRDALDRLQAFEPDPYDGHIIEYVNPETGGPVMPTMSFTMQLLKGGQKTQTHRHTSSTIYCVAEGDGYTQVDDVRLEWHKNDVFVVPTWAWHSHINSTPGKPAVLFGVTDAPTVQKLALYREQAQLPNGDVKWIAQP
ncbi:MAG TPA: cupin domain-containing protein [Pseudolabrys sp.]|nr:cupin domain-containing protein [Pseudolabrys sp.]